VTSLRFIMQTHSTGAQPERERPQPKDLLQLGAGKQISTYNPSARRSISISLSLSLSLVRTWPRIEFLQRARLYWIFGCSATAVWNCCFVPVCSLIRLRTTFGSLFLFHLFEAKITNCVFKTLCGNLHDSKGDKLFKCTNYPNYTGKC
jgi:hypothetical protein